MPGNRTRVTSMNIGNYFRPSPDNRLIFGGRACFSASTDQRSAIDGELVRTVDVRRDGDPNLHAP
ncbi:FAD dependent oxidoreductase (plasmid) [Sinorhizobium americanum CCGM7]|nr:FAD dependent oxidoreductase [Sinorhizobium americanum CCGM7]